MNTDGRSMRIGFVSGVTHWWQKHKLAAKYLKMRLEGLIYPDVYVLPLYFADRFDFIKEGEHVAPGSYDLIMSELQGSDRQLQYLQSLVASGGPPLAVIPGPPEILSRDMTHKKLLMARRILQQARYVWAYSEQIRDFCNGLIGAQHAIVIPWPFDLKTTVRIAEQRPRGSNGCRVLLQVPLRFSGVTHNHPFVLKGVLMDVYSQLPRQVRSRLTFHTFVYTPEDAEQYTESGFEEALPVKLERKMSYVSFVQFMSECDAVINLTAGSILGRITFLAAALRKPGIFSRNSDVNQRLYPGSCVEPLATQRLRDLLWGLLAGLGEGQPDRTFMPCEAATAEIGDLRANTAFMRELLTREVSCAAS